MFSHPPVPTDPLPWLTPRFQRAGCFRPVNADGSPDRDAAEATLGVLQSLVNALHDDAEPYTVRFGKIGSAMTQYDERTVSIGVGVLTDPDLTDGQRAAILLAFVYHEVGHVRFTKRWSSRVRKEYGDDSKLIHTVSNCASDVMLECQMIATFPGYAEALPLGLWYAGNKGEVMVKGTPSMATPDKRFSEAFASVRYPWLRDWDSLPQLAEWLAWWREWYDRACVATTFPKHLAVVQEALDKVAEPPIPEPEPEPEQGSEEEAEDLDVPEKEQPELEPSDEPSEDEDEDLDADEGDDDTESGAKLDSDDQGTDDSEPEDTEDDDHGDGDLEDTDDVEDDDEGEGNEPEDDEGNTDADEGDETTDGPEGDEPGEGNESDDDGESDEGDEPTTTDGGGEDDPMGLDDEDTEGVANESEDVDSIDVGNEGEDGEGSSVNDDPFGGADDDDGSDEPELPTCPVDASETHYDDAVMSNIDVSRSQRRIAPKKKSYLIPNQAGGALGEVIAEEVEL